MSLRDIERIGRGFALFYVLPFTVVILLVDWLL